MGLLRRQGICLTPRKSVAESQISRRILVLRFWGAPLSFRSQVRGAGLSSRQSFSASSVRPSLPALSLLRCFYFRQAPNIEDLSEAFPGIPLPSSRDLTALSRVL